MKSTKGNKVQTESLSEKNFPKPTNFSNLTSRRYMSNNKPLPDNNIPETNSKESKENSSHLKFGLSKISEKKIVKLYECNEEQKTNMKYYSGGKHTNKVIQKNSNGNKGRLGPLHIEPLKKLAQKILPIASDSFIESNCSFIKPGTPKNEELHINICLYDETTQLRIPTSTINKSNMISGTSKPKVEILRSHSDQRKAYNKKNDIV